MKRWILALLLTSCAHSTGTVTPTPTTTEDCKELATQVSAVQMACVEAHNELRAKEGLEPLAADANVECKAVMLPVRQ